MKFHQTKLANGLSVIAELNPAVHSVALGFFVRTGSRDETPAVSGVSHFLEHMVFKGSKKYSADDVNRIFDEVGAKYNAATAEEGTLFYGAVLPEYLPQAFELFANILRPALRQEDFDMEKNVIARFYQLSKGNPIERRWCSHVPRACQGVLFDALHTVLGLMHKTKTHQGTLGHGPRPEHTL